MQTTSLFKRCTAVALCLTLVACGDGGFKLGGGNTTASTSSGNPPREEALQTTSIWEAFANRNTETTVKVNKYIWSAAIEVLDFMPIQSIDPFTGVIVTGYGTPPGGSRSYRATVLVRDPSLDARSLNVALLTRGGAAAPAATTRAIEDAILTRARQLRISDNRL
jgi:hypothetical protein